MPIVLTLTRKTMKNLANKITKFYTGLTEIHHLQTDKNKRINNDHPFAILLNALLAYSNNIMD